MAISFTSDIRTDLIDPVETTDVDRITISHIYDLYVTQNNIPRDPLKSLGPARELDDCLGLIRQAITTKETQEHKIEDAKLQSFTYEDPSEDMKLEAVTICPTLRLPGKFAKGPPSKSPQVIREITGHIREEGPDPEFHDYRVAIVGKWFDNWIDLVCWGRTNKEAFARARWLEDLIEEYAWWFTASGISRIIGQGCKERRVLKIGSNVIYGYPFELYIRTEKLVTVREKALERLIIEVGLASS